MKKQPNADLRKRVGRLQTWTEVASYGSEIVKRGDDAKWELGALVERACDPTVGGGRPVRGSEGKTIAALAREVGEERSVLSSVYGNWLFFKDIDLASLPPNLTYRMLSRCRRDSGWKRGKPVTQEQRDRALAQAYRLADNDGPRRSNDDRPYWVRKLDASMSDLDAIESADDAPDAVRGFARMALTLAKETREKLYGKA